MRLFLAALLLWLAGAIFVAPATAQPISARDVTQAIRASWYDCRRPGECSRSRRTANGEKFDPNAMTCAHRTAKFGTRYRVHYRGRSAVCRVNDRGPFIRGRSLDLARAVARTIGMMGIAVVRIERL